MSAIMLITECSTKVGQRKAFSLQQKEKHHLLSAKPTSGVSASCVFSQGGSLERRREKEDKGRALEGGKLKQERGRGKVK